MEASQGMNLVDSDVLIDVQRATPAAVAWLAGFQGDIALPAPVAWELLIGSRDAGELRRAERFLSTFDVEEIEASDSALAGRLIVAHSLSSGLGIPDFLIAAQALNRSATLLTFNLRHFSAVPGLDAQAPYSR